MSMCLPCVAGFPFECENDEPCKETELIEGPARGGPAKDGAQMRDVLSTGRKRAAVLFPITEGMICEWAELKLAGGGPKPIIGCNSNIASDRHHGPDKSVLSNYEGNVHRICDHCHNRWHAANDPFYGERPPAGEPYYPPEDIECLEHDPDTKATMEEIAANELYWFGHKPPRVEESNDEHHLGHSQLSA